MRQNTLGVTVDGSVGAGLAAVVLRDVDPTAVLAATIDSSGLSSPSPTTVVGLRVDYLDGDAVLGSVFYRDPSFTGAFDPSSFPRFPSGGPEVPASAVMNPGSVVSIHVAASAPAGWVMADGGARRMRLSLVLVAPQGKATLLARLSD